MSSEVGAGAVVLLLTLASFSPILQNGFVNFDDEANLVFNSQYRGFGAAQLRWMFALRPAAHYFPLTWLSFAADHAVWGLNPAGFHLTSLLLHAANALLFYAICMKLFALAVPGRPPASLPAAFAAMVFAAHPLRVESVAWATERSDVLSGFFYLLTILLYMKAQERDKGRLLAAALAAYGLSLSSKAIGMTLPLSLLILDAYPLRRLPGQWRQALREKIPFAVMAALFAAIAFLTQSRAGILWGLDSLGLLARCAQAFYGLAFYAFKTLLPLGLLPLYPSPKPFDVFSPLFVSSAVAVLAAVAWIAASARRKPALAACCAFYAATLFPVLGLVQNGPHLVADRYSYLSCLGWAALAGGWLLTQRWGQAILAGAAVLALAGLTWRQTLVWRDSESFWSHMAEADPKHAISRNFLGNLRLENGRGAEAEAFFREALRIQPDYGAAHNNLGNLLSNTGRLEESLDHYRRALRASPGHPAVNYNWAVALARLGRLEEAAARFRAEAAINPEHAPTRLALEKAVELLKNGTIVFPDDF